MSCQVPDKENPSFDGEIPLDYRTVHLVECADQKTDALFNKIVRDSVIKIRWDVDWFERYDGQDDDDPDKIKVTSFSQSSSLLPSYHITRIPLLVFTGKMDWQLSTILYPYGQFITSGR